MIVQVLAGGGDALCDGAIELAVGDLHGYAHRVLDGVRVRRSVANDAHPLDAQQGCSAIFRVIETFLEVGERLAREQKSNLAADGGL